MLIKHMKKLKNNMILKQFYTKKHFAKHPNYLRVHFGQTPKSKPNLDLWQYNIKDWNQINNRTGAIISEGVF